jgi:hypothetical protein
MVGGYPAPGHRIGSFVRSPELLTEDGWRLFDHAVT